jgi:integrase
MGYAGKSEVVTILERVRYITPNEFRRLLKASITNERAYMLFYILGNTGLRIVEAHRLRAGDLHDTDPVLRVHTAKQKRPVIHESTIAHEAADKIRAWIRKCKFEKNDILFPWSIRYSQKLWYKFAGLAGLRVSGIGLHKGRGIHCIRHMFGLRLADRDVPPIYILKQMRHHSFSSTDQYLHTVDTKRLVEKLGAIT